MRSYSLRAAPRHEGPRKFEALKFREVVKQLESKNGRARLERVGGANVRPSEQKFSLLESGRKYEGTREAVGTSSQASSCYVALRVQEGAMTMMPLAEWFTFRPAVTHSTIGLDDAEALMDKSDKRSALRDKRVASLRKRDGDEDEGSGAAAGSDREADDDFDDGTGPAWVAGEMRDEDGNEGLDMQDEDLFDDDEDDSFEAAKARELQYGCVSTDDAELAFHEALEETRHVEEERQRKEMSAALAKVEGSQVQSMLEDEEEDGTRAGDRSSEWAQQTKSMLNAERQRRRREAVDSEDDDDDPFDESEEIAEGLRQQADKAAEKAVTTAQSSGAAPAAAERKRALSPGGGASAPIDRAKMAKVAQAAAARGGGSAAVEERDLVLLLHSRGKMLLKEMIQHFKAFTASREEKSAFIKMVSRVAYTSSDQDGAKVARLKESTLVEYNLQE